MEADAASHTKEFLVYAQQHDMTSESKKVNYHSHHVRHYENNSFLELMEVAPLLRLLDCHVEVTRTLMVRTWKPFKEHLMETTTSAGFVVTAAIYLD